MKAGSCSAFASESFGGRVYQLSYNGF
jgi:hypothetical protein